MEEPSSSDPRRGSRTPDSPPEFDAGRTERAGTVELGPITVAATAGDYYVEIREGTFYSCTCPDFTMRLKSKMPCKHVLSLVQQVGERLVRWPEVQDVLDEMEAEPDV